MIVDCTGNIFDSDVHNIVVAVNTQGVAGAGQALAAKERYPDWFRAYKSECDGARMKPGGIHFFPRKMRPNVISFATKDHWKNRSRIEWIDDGMRALAALASEVRIDSVALGALGCGLGGLRWSDVLPLIERAARTMPDVRVMVYGPRSIQSP